MKALHGKSGNQELDKELSGAQNFSPSWGMECTMTHQKQLKSLETWKDRTWTSSVSAKVNGLALDAKLHPTVRPFFTQEKMKFTLVVLPLLSAQQ